MLSEKFPSTEFKEFKIKSIDELSDRYCYILKIEFNEIQNNYINNIISLSKCEECKNGVFDNGRVVMADKIILTITEVDLKLILSYYKYKSYKILECYRACKSYLPEKFYNFILDKYVEKTKLKGVKDREVEYALAKNQFNSLYRNGSY